MHFAPSYLYMRSLISLLQCFLFLFSWRLATIHPQSASVSNNKSLFGSFCLPDNQLSVSYSGSQPPCCIVLSFSLSLPPSAPCYLWSPKLLGSREETWSYTIPTAELPQRFQTGLVRDRKPSVTFATLLLFTVCQIYSSSMINIFT